MSSFHQQKEIVIQALQEVLGDEIMPWTQEWIDRISYTFDSYMEMRRQYEGMEDMIDRELRRSISSLWVEMVSVWIQENNQANMYMSIDPERAREASIKSYHLSLLMQELNHMLDEGDLAMVMEEIKQFYQRGKLASN